MKLYIPTSSLNADSILSCESVTPARECRKRVFGYSHFEPLEELRQFDFCTLAFSKVPRFSIYDDSRVNYRMVVEIDLASPQDSGLCHVGICEDTDIFATAKPIHLSPTNTRLLFYKREEMDYVYHSCSDSAKCKFFDFFKYGFSGVASSEQGAILSKCVDVINIQKIGVSYSENAYNKVKGFIWGYAIGCMLSRTPETANLLRIQKRIYDIISSTRNDTSIPDALKSELVALDSEYTKFDPILRLAKSKWDDYLRSVVSSQPEFGSNVTTANIDKLLRELGVETAAKSKFLSEHNLNLRKVLSSYSFIGNLGYEQYNHELATHTKSAIYHENLERLKHLSFKDSLDVDRHSYHTVMLSIEDKESDFFNKILYRIIWENLIPSLEEIRINRKDVAINVVKTLKAITEESGAQWQDSEVQAYFDRMRKNISKYDPFVLTDIPDTVLQSVAAFVLKGEDYESLKSYLEVNAVSDYRYALAMWGAMIGYVSIPRSLFDGFNRSTVITLYPQVESILGNSDFKLSNKTIITEEPKDSPVTNSIETPELFRRKVMDFFESTIVKKQRKEKREKLREGLDCAFDVFGGDTDPMKFVAILNDFVDYGWAPNKTPWKAMRDYLTPDYANKTSRGKSMLSVLKRIMPSTQPILPFDTVEEVNMDSSSHCSTNNHCQIRQDTKLFFSKEDRGVSDTLANGITPNNAGNNTIAPIFVYDENCWKYLQRIVPRELWDDVHGDLMWFQNEYAKGKDSKYYAKASRENTATIDAFRRYLAKKKYADKISIPDIIEFLIKLYVR